MTKKTYFYNNMKHPIIIVEDDNDDCELIQSALNEIGVTNEQKCFKDGTQALKYLQTTHEKTFLILSDINMPHLNGFELKQQINSNEKLKTQAIPFVFFTTSNSQKDIDTAYNLSAQGFFTKPGKYETLKELLQSVTKYWQKAQTPTIRYSVQ